VLLVLTEGGASFTLVAIDFLRSRPTPLAEDLHTRYDADLGWSNRPDMRLPNMYGPGVYLNTNGRAFRGIEEVRDARPAGRRRIVCSGDSFTLGYGVTDDEAWCAQLAGPDVQTVNMGQGAYGVDQAYLWYRRDASSLEHDVHLFAFITHDFRRAQQDRFEANRFKPVLRVRGDSIVVGNVPVPRSRVPEWLAMRRALLSKLRIAEFAARARSRLSGRRAATDSLARDSMAAALVPRIFAELAAANRAKRSQLVLVYLPVERRLESPDVMTWRDRVRRAADSLGVPLVDLYPAFSALPSRAMDSLFIRPGTVAFRGASGHYTAAGNRWVADQLREALTRLAPETLRSRARSPAVTP
jgi:hypothetical protein